MEPEIEPDWKLLFPPASCAKCGKPFQREEFEIRHVDAEVDILNKTFCTWCKTCYADYLEQGEG